MLRKYRRFAVFAAAALPLLALRSGAAPAPDKETKAQTAAEAVLDKAIKSLGGERRLSELACFTAKTEMQWSNFPANVVVTTRAETSYQVPDRKRLVMEIVFDTFKITYVEVIAGNQGWTLKDGDGVAGKMPERDIALSQRAFFDPFDVLTLPRYKGKPYKLAPLGECKVEDKVAVGILVSHDGKPETWLYFEKDTGFPLKREYVRTGKSLVGKSESATLATIYAEYKDSNGVQYPSRITTLRDGVPIREETVTEFKVVEKFEDALFAKPE